MSLLKPRPMTPARIAACRRNALKSTGPRTERGKIQSSLNALRTGSYSPTYLMLFRGFLEAPGVPVDEIAQILLTPEEARHPVFADRVEFLREVELEMASNLKRPYRRRKVLTRLGDSKLTRSGELIENNDSENTTSFQKLRTY